MGAGRVTPIVPSSRWTSSWTAIVPAHCQAPASCSSSRVAIHPKAYRGPSPAAAVRGAYQARPSSDGSAAARHGPSGWRLIRYCAVKRSENSLKVRYHHSPIGKTSGHSWVM